MPDIANLILDLRSNDAATRVTAATQLAKLGEEASPAASALARATADEVEDVREWSVEALEAIGAPPINQLDELAQLLSDESSDVGYHAATLIGRLGESAAPAVDALAAALESSPAMIVRQQSAMALGKIGPNASAATPALERAAMSDDPRLKRLADRALTAIRG